ncbi:MAG TPA: hypothetical protein VIH19_07615 [Candidatus Limnocylindria bacterium]
MTRRRTVSLAVMLAALVALAGMQAGTVLAGPATSAPKFLEWNSMVGVPQAFTGTAMPQLNIRGVIGGGVPWTLTKGKGSIRADGHLKIKVDGLVLASTLSNPATTFRATVSCLTSTGDTMNVQTGTFPATTGLASEGGGDSTIEADLAIPKPCIAPIVFVTSATGSWFAVTGN